MNLIRTCAVGAFLCCFAPPARAGRLLPRSIIIQLGLEASLAPRTASNCQVLLIKAKYMENDILIRKADSKDLEDILRLNYDLFKKEYKEYDNSLNLEWTYNEGRKYFENRIVKESGFAEVAEAKGRIIGYLCGGISDKLVYRNTAKNTLNWKICWWKKILEVLE